MYSVALESLNSKSDLRAIVGAIMNIFNVDKVKAVEYAKNLPLTLAENLPEKEARLMVDMFVSLGATIRITPPFDELEERPIRDFKTVLPKRNLPAGCLVFIILCLIGSACFVTLNHEKIINKLKPSPAKSEKLLQKGDMVKAKRSIQRQLRTKPQDSELLTLQGKFYIGAARKKMNAERWKSFGEAGALPELDTAISFFRKAEAFNPSDGSIPRWISIAEQMRQNFQDAEISARRSVAVEPSDADNWNQLGAVLVDLKAISLAEQSFYNALKIEPNNLPALKNLAVLNLYYTKDAERAAKFLFAFLGQKGSDNDVDSFQLRVDLTSAMIGDFNPPWEKLSPPLLPFDEYEKRREKLSANPQLRNDPLLQEQLGLLFMSRGEKRAAEDCFIRAVQLSKQNDASRKMLAIMYLKDGSYEKALAVMQAAASNNSRDPFFWKNIGILQKYFRANQAEASKALNRYFALGGDSYSKRVKREL